MNWPSHTQSDKPFNVAALQSVHLQMRMVPAVSQDWGGDHGNVAGQCSQIFVSAAKLTGGYWCLPIDKVLIDSVLPVATRHRRNQGRGVTHCYLRSSLSWQQCVSPCVTGWPRVLGLSNISQIQSELLLGRNISELVQNSAHSLPLGR